MVKMKLTIRHMRNHTYIAFPLIFIDSSYLFGTRSVGASEKEGNGKNENIFVLNFLCSFNVVAEELSITTHFF